MKGRMRAGSLGVLSIVAAAVVALTVGSGHAQESPVGSLLGQGPIGFGVDVAPLKRGVTVEGDPRVAAIAFDLKLRWPGAAGEERRSVLAQLQPYLAVGPALLVAETPHDTPPLAEPNGPDASVAVGVKGGAGVTWNLGRSLSLFGQYSFTRATSDRIGGAGAHSGIDGDLGAHDFLYGLSVRF